MPTPDLIISKRKGEVLLNFENDVFESVKVLFHANSVPPLAHTLHFGLKPGHLFVYVKRRGESSGRWLLEDAGYLNYFRMDKTVIKQTQYNTLDKQKLFARGFLRVREREQAVEMASFSLFPLHRRRVTFTYDATRAALRVRDAYLGNRRVNWNFADRLEQPRAFFRQERLLEL